MSTAPVLDLLNAFAFTLDQQAEELDDVELDAILACNFIGAAKAEGAAGAFRCVAKALRSNASGPGVEPAHSCEVPFGPGDGPDMTPADLHDEWTEVLA